MGTLSQLREIKSSYKMPPIVDDEVIDAAAAEKTEDAADGKAAEAEAKEEAVEEEKEEEANNSTEIKSKRWCYFSLHDKKTRQIKEMKIPHRYLPKPFEENPLEKKSSTSPQFI